MLLVQPERMAGWDLVQYIRHLAENRQQTERYEIAFWGKLFYPWAVLVMMALALPFAYLHVRAGGVSFKIFTGVMLGVAFYGMNKLFAHIGLLNTWPPLGGGGAAEPGRAYAGARGAVLDRAALGATRGGSASRRQLLHLCN